MRIVLWWRNLYPTKDRATGVTNSGTRRRIVRNLGYAGSAGRKDTWRETVITDNNYSNNNNNAHHQKKKQQKYRSVCKRCGQKGGHSSSRCPNVSRCKICTENHETRECPRNLGGTVSKKRREIEEQQSFVEQKRRAVMMEEVGGGRRGDEETGGDDGAEKRRKRPREEESETRSRTEDEAR